MKPALSVEGISKHYYLGSEIDTSLNFREMLITSFKAPLKRFRKLKGSDESQTSLWALKDISFDLEPGEILGVIGRNGAGKSTLLKILSRITTPTSGTIKYRGRLASLLEVGTGFHPELTGKENIFLNGAILGMSRNEIQRSFDEIVDFAGVEKFLDTPVKRYSSGMYVRLAFSVAAHLNTDVLLVDEVLAVGDVEFQNKCLGRMKSISQAQGKTVIFVSHNLDAIRRICTSGINLRKGEISFHGQIGTAIEHYLKTNHISSGASEIASTTERWGSGIVKIVSIKIKDHLGLEASVLQAGLRYLFEVRCENTADHVMLSDVLLNIEICDNTGSTVQLYSSVYTNQVISIGEKITRITCCIEKFNLVAEIIRSHCTSGQEMERRWIVLTM